MGRTLISCLLLLVILPGHARIHAQTSQGDQFLDGIGETALIARYLFNGNAEDASRNGYHATLQGSQAGFVEDSQFGKVMSLPGGRSGAYVQIPGQALIGAESLSVTGWLHVKDLTPWQRFFDVGQGTNR